MGLDDAGLRVYFLVYLCFSIKITLTLANIVVSIRVLLLTLQPSISTKSLLYHRQSSHLAPAPIVRLPTSPDLHPS
jgi:hypothetical protein